MSQEIDISYRRIVHLTAPVLIGQLSHTMMGVVDTVMVGRLGVTALAAVGLGNFLAWWLLSFVVGMITGVNTLVAQAVGAGRPKAAGVAFWQGIYVGLILAAVLAAFWPLVPWILRVTGATPEAAPPFAVQEKAAVPWVGAGLLFSSVSSNRPCTTLTFHPTRG